MECCQKNNQQEEGQVKTENVSDVSTGTALVVATRNPWQIATIVLATALVFMLAFGVLVSTNMVQIPGMGGAMNMDGKMDKKLSTDTTSLSSVMPISVNLPIAWGNIGTQLLSTGVIDEQKLTALYESRGGMSDTVKEMLYEKNVKKVVMTEENAQDLLNIFWAFGVGNKNPILTEGPMTNKEYGGDPSRFAATGGWTLRAGGIMEHYSAHSFVTLTPEQQSRVETVAKGIYRPCCNNSTHFPDCNHGMAMLGLLELMAATDTSEEDMYDVALAVNTYWFPSTYETISAFLTEKGTSFEDVPAKDILGQELSSASGFGAVKASLTAPATSSQGGGGCSV